MISSGINDDKNFMKLFSYKQNEVIFSTQVFWFFLDCHWFCLPNNVMIIKSNCANVTTEVESFYPQNDECKAALSPPVSHCVQWSESFLQVQTKKRL